MKALVVHPGTQHSFRLARELCSRNALAGFYTGLAFTSGGIIDRVMRCMPHTWQRKIANRRIDGVASRLLHTKPLIELRALWQLRAGKATDAVFFNRNERFQRLVQQDRIAASSAVIGFDTAAWEIADQCAQASVPLVLDQSTSHRDAKPRFFTLMKEQFPEWCCGIERRSPALRQAEQHEHDMAKCVVAASSFTQKTLVDHGVSVNKIRVNPYGVDCERFQVREVQPRRPMRFLFVGLVNARKGVPLLLAAWRNLRSAGAELWIVGAASAETKKLLPELPGLRYFGRVPHDEVGQIMQQCDVFVFPSYFEGFGLVLLEAMASGLPIVTTTATAGPDIVTEGQDGWVIEPGSLAQLEERMAYCLGHADEVREMGRAARATAEKFTWTAYGDRWMQILGEVCGRSLEE